MGYGYYVYGIFPTPGPQDLAVEGLDAQPIQSLTYNGFAFLYSSAQKDRYLASRRNLLCHESVLEAAMLKGYRTLLPLQFGSTIQDWEQVDRDLLQPQGNDLRALFAALEGQREVSVKIFWDENAELQRLMDESPHLKATRDALEGKALSMDEVVSFGQTLEQAIAHRQDEIVAAFRTALEPLAREVVENDPLTDAMIFNTAYLIPWDTEPDFGRRVEATDAQFPDRLRVRYNNLTAPYNFAQLPRRE